MDVSIGYVISFIPAISVAMFALWRLAKFENRHMRKNDCERIRSQLGNRITQLKTETKETLGRFDERIETLFRITERQERAVDKLEDIIRKNGVK